MEEVQPLAGSYLLTGRTTMRMSLSVNPAMVALATLLSGCSHTPPQRAAQAVPRKGYAWVVPRVGMEFVWIRAMKSWGGKYEVTNAEYREFRPNHSSGCFGGHTLNDDRQPVVSVSFADACEYARWLTEHEREAGRLPEEHVYRLPSRGEWTLLAQCGTKYRSFPWGSGTVPEYGNYAGTESVLTDRRNEDYTDAYVVTCPVERSGSNGWELHGVGGNARECTLRTSSLDSGFDAWRGASWRTSSALGVSTLFRLTTRSERRDPNGGFRLILGPVAENE